MNPKPSSTSANFSSSPDLRVDAVLRAYSHAEPAEGLESRIAARIATAPRQSLLLVASGSRWLILRRFSAGALSAAAGCAIVVATVHHAQRQLPPQPFGGASFGAVGSATGRIVPTQATAVSPAINPASPRTPPRSRALLSRNHSRRPLGAATPRSPYAPGDQQEAGGTAAQQ